MSKSRQNLVKKKCKYFYNKILIHFIILSKKKISHYSQATLEIEKYGALSLKITGGCCKLPDPVDTLFFSCRVREKLIKSLNIENDTVTSWKLKPEVFGNYFFVDEVLHVPSKNFTTCTITYAPLIMNSKDNPHKVYI